ncbi:hypothetical protein ACSBLW_14960 [Thioclava sp. FR2]|uniref:hypothetical protein n=1 Tax=Thioclava sp. FR2 TaxID=3445780 RepID=UPI003EB9D9F1
MRRLIFSATLAAVMALPASVALANGASEATRFCQGAALNELERRGHYAETRFNKSSVKKIANHSFSVTGAGRSGQDKFSFSCRYNTSSGRTDHVNVKVSAGRKASAGDVAGAIIGAAIAGAIIDSVNRKNGGNSYDNSYTSPGRIDYPEPGVECYAAQSACYRNGNFDPRYTRQYYADGE